MAKLSAMRKNFTHGNRNLDRLVAEQVMGIVFCTCCNWASNGDEWSQPYVKCDDCGNMAPFPHRYSTDITAAYEVFDRMHSGNCISWVEHKSGPLTEHWEAVFNSEDHLGKGEGSTAAHAICLAALDAIGVKT